MGNSRKVKIVRERFKEARKIKKKTMQEICIKARVQYETVRYCLRNEAMMPDILDKLARAIGCDVGYLTGEHSYIYNPALHKNHMIEEDTVFGIDSNGIEILVYESGKSEFAFDSASDAFNKVMSYLHDALSIDVISSDGQKRKYTFADYLREREEIEFYNDCFWENKPVPDWNEIDISEVDYSDEFEEMIDAISKLMQYTHDNKDRIIQAYKEEAKNHPAYKRLKEEEEYNGKH